MPPELLDPRIVSAQERVNGAVEAFERAFEALQNAGADADLEDLQRNFDQAEEAVAKAEEAKSRVARVIDARKLHAVLQTDDDGSGGDAPGTRIAEQEKTYRKFEGRADKWDDASFFYFRDLWFAKQGDLKAAERLQKHMGEMAAEGRAMNSTDGTGGEFIPPLWMQEEWIHLARAGRATANALRGMPLPPGTDSINLPRLATGTTTAVQADGGTVSSTDGTTDSVSAAVKTAAGQVDISQQLLDRSVPGIDIVLFEDLAAAYNTNIGTQVISGSGSGANALGILTVSGLISVTYTDASPTVPELYPKPADGIQQILTNRYMPPTVVVMHPRRWYWMLAQVDSSNRPLVVPSAGGAQFNGLAVAERVGSEQIVGTFHGLPVLLDPNIPTNLGASTNEDRIIVMRADDLFLFEDGAPKSRAMEQVLSGTLQVRLQVYGYFATIPHRYPKAIAVISGTGLATPTF